MTWSDSSSDSSESAHSLSSGVFNNAGVQVKGTVGSSFITDVIRADRNGIESAVKILTPAASNDTELRNRFLLNARYNQSLGEFTGVRISEIVDTGPRPYYVMDKVAQSSLLEVIRLHSPIDSDWLVNLLLPIARSLDTIHQRNVLHANIKPSNILIEVENGEEKFLLADYLEPSLTATSATLTGAGIYAAPEFRAGMPVSNRSDIYSLSAIMYEALTSNVPGSARYENDGFHVWRNTNQIPELCQVNPEISRGVSEIIMHGISPQAISRQASASALVEETLRSLEQPRTRVKVEEPAKEHVKVPMLLIVLGVFVGIILLFVGFKLVSSLFGGSSKDPSASTQVTVQTSPDGSVDDPNNELTDAEKQLASYLPPGNQDCLADRRTGDNKRWLLSTAAFSCTAEGLSELYYGLFEDGEDLDMSYEKQKTDIANELAANGKTFNQTAQNSAPCSASENEWGQWGSKGDSGFGGAFICLSDPKPRIVWTETKTKIIGDATSSTGNINELMQWWANESGPK